MLNHISLMGRLVREPELRRTGSGIAVASFTLAVERDFKEGGSNEKKTDYIDCVAWRQAGEFAAKYLAKGRMAAVSGRLQIRDWTDKDGNKRRSAEVKVENVYFADSKAAAAPASPQAAAPFAYGGSLYPAPADTSPDFQLLEDDDAQLPF